MKGHLTLQNAPIIGITLLASIGVGYLITTSLNRLGGLEEALVVSNSRISYLEEELAALQTENEVLNYSLQVERNRGVANAVQLGKINSTVGTLEKLSQTDRELLKKYSKTYFLNEHYVPLSLKPIPLPYLTEGDTSAEIHSNVWPFLEQLLLQAQSDGVELSVTSAYRSFGEQAVLKSNYRFTYGAGTANQFSAEQGYSEHQLGTTVDFVTKENSNTLSGFDTTKAYTWLTSNAHRYGFVLSYPKDNGYYTFEPWHWRFVGVALATKLHTEGGSFYATDQRIIDTFLATIFD